ncbi:MAG: hypothetical protein ACTSYD_15150 [Candidatus Heimdallarchaeaceae archaeon]
MSQFHQFLQIAEEIEQKLVDLDTKRDELMRISRKIIKLCGQCIENFHLQRISDAKEQIAATEILIQQVNEYLKHDPYLYQNSIINVAFQEYVEAKLLISIVEEERLIPVKDLSVYEPFYLLGIADLIGELRRYILEQLVDEKIEVAKKFYSIMRELYGSVMQIEYGKNLVSEFRRKKDTARVLIERTLSDLFVAINTKKFVDKNKT